MRPLLALIALLLLLPGCGGSDPVEAAGGVVRLRIDEYRILPRAMDRPEIAILLWCKQPNGRWAILG